MSCPNCGGTERRLIAPGYYQCISETFEPGWSHAPGKVDMYPVECGNMYQEGIGTNGLGLCTGGPNGECGMGAIGQCVRDKRPFCGKHRVEIDGASYCAQCARQLADDRYARARTQWMERYNSLPAGGTVELKALLTGEEYRLEHRFDHLAVDEIEAVANRLLDQAGAPADFKQSTLKYWHRAVPLEYPTDWSPNPAFFTIADPRCLERLWKALHSQTRLNRERISKRAEQEALRRYRRGTRLWIAALMAALALVAISVVAAAATSQSVMLIGVALGFTFGMVVIVNMAYRKDRKPIDTTFYGPRGGLND